MDETTGPDTETVREALAWFRTSPHVLERIEDSITGRHAATIVRAALAVDDQPDIAIIEVQDGEHCGIAYPIVERNTNGPAGWRSGAHFYSDADVLSVRPVRAALTAGPDEALRDAYEAAKSAVMHGVTAPKGASHMAGGVSEDEALGYAATLIGAVEARGGVAALARDVPALVEPDDDDGVLLWMGTSRALDVQMDNTSPGNIPPRFVIGGVEMDTRAATWLRDALTAAITEAQR